MKRYTYEQQPDKYSLKDGIGINPFGVMVNALAQYEEIFAGREFWIITDLWETLCPIPVKIQSVSNGCLNVIWNITEDYTEEYEEVDVTDLYHSQEEAKRAILANRWNTKGGARMKSYKHSNGRLTARGTNGRFKKPTFKDIFGIEANTSPLICGKCGYGSDGEFIPLVTTGYCPKCENQEGHRKREVKTDGKTRDINSQ